MFKIFNNLTLLAALVLSVPSFAQNAGATIQLEGKVQVERQSSVAGESRVELADPVDVVPGDTLLFTTTFRNDTGETVENFVVTNPLPEAVRLAAAGDFKVSLDGVDYADLAELTVTDADGKIRSATLDDVTHLRWVLAQVATGQSGSVAYRGVIR